MQNNIVRKLDATDDLLNDLNPEQYEAVTTLDRALLVLSGAGTGKTKVLTTKIAYIIENGYAFPSQILAVTFSNKAAREMKERLFSMTSGADGVWLGTFHSICAKILRYHADLLGFSRDFTIIDMDDQLKMIKQILKELNLDKKMANSVATKISSWKDKCIHPDDKRVNANTIEGRIYRIYQERIFSYGSVDFGDLLMYVVRLFKENEHVLQKYREKFRYILVDEYQDTNTSQYMWLRMLSSVGSGLCCVGDDDQAIYGWRGAEVGNILRFEQDFMNTKIVRLERNYRSGGHILGAASSLIAHNAKRLGKTIWTEGNEGEKLLIYRAYNGFDEAKFVVNQIELLRSNRYLNFCEMAILVRAGFQTREFEEQLVAHGIPYRVVGGLKFYDRQEIKDIIAYMRLICHQNDSLAFGRIINIPRRGVGAAALSKIHAIALEHGVSLFQATEEILKSDELRPSLTTALSQFVEFIKSMQSKNDITPAEATRIILAETGYMNALVRENTIESQTRVENLKELQQALEEFNDLPSFLEHVSLVTDSHSPKTEDLVNIMTLHSAKGLEFDAVFLCGWEEGIFPNSMSLMEGNLEEERRLAYVGITRARKYVFITHAMNRKVYNQWQSNLPSRFLSELPEEHVIHSNRGRREYSKYI
ncbi:MAG: UvrD-helicase domain-containing protein [Holosporaceae bacterium]|nr:UvrD-helicase domain-containing protein [Holosporaceae bacterium]